MLLEPIVLEGRHVRLEPFTPDLREDVRAAVDADPDAFRLFPANWAGEDFDRFWSAWLADTGAGRLVAHAVRRKRDGAVVGTSCFLNLRLPDRGLEIGGTYYRPDARGGAVNPEAKRLLLGRAFEAGAMRVELLTDARNLRSQAAIAKLGATREGVLRQHRLTWTGHRRDTVVFSILDHEWPQVREVLDARLAAWA